MAQGKSPGRGQSKHRRSLRSDRAGAQRGLGLPTLMVGLVAVMALAALAVWVRGQGVDVRLQPRHPAVVALGQTVYAQHCASCHGADFKGQPNWRDRSADGLLPAPPHDGTGHTWHHPDAVLFNMVKQGVAQTANMPDYKSSMPAYEGKLTDDEIVAVLSYIKSTWTAEVQAQHDAVNAAAGARR